MTWFSEYDKVMYHKSDMYPGLRKYVGYNFGYNQSAQYSFFRVFKNAVKKKLPIGWTIAKWWVNWFNCTGVLKDDKGRYVYLHVRDIRYWNDGWINDILIRTMEHDKDWTGGFNHRADIFNLDKQLLQLRRD
jgi:hypothetical protein